MWTNDWFYRCHRYWGGSCTQSCWNCKARSGSLGGVWYAVVFFLLFVGLWSDIINPLGSRYSDLMASFWWILLQTCPFSSPCIITSVGRHCGCWKTQTQTYWEGRPLPRFAPSRGHQRMKTWEFHWQRRSKCRFHFSMAISGTSIRGTYHIKPM